MAKTSSALSPFAMRLLAILKVDGKWLKARTIAQGHNIQGGSRAVATGMRHLVDTGRVKIRWVSGAGICEYRFVRMSPKP